MSNRRNRRKVRPNVGGNSNHVVFPRPEPEVPEDEQISLAELEKYLDKQRPQHPDWTSIAAACTRNDYLIQVDKTDTGEVIQEFCDPQSLIYVATQRALRVSSDPESIKTIAAMFIDGFLAACVAQDRAFLDMNNGNTDYEEYERDAEARGTQFETWRKMDSDIFEFRVDRDKDDDRSFSKGSMEWLHDMLWIYLAARIAAHWDRTGEPCKRVKLNVQVTTEST